MLHTDNGELHLPGLGLEQSPGGPHSKTDPCSQVLTAVCKASLVSCLKAGPRGWGGRSREALECTKVTAQAHLTKSEGSVIHRLLFSGLSPKMALPGISLQLTDSHRMSEFIQIYQQLHPHLSCIRSELVCLGPRGLTGWNLPQFLPENGHGYQAEWTRPEQERNPPHGPAQ